MFNNNVYRWLGTQYNYEDQLNSTNRDSTNHWSYYSDHGWHEYSSEHPHGSYKYAGGVDSYNPEWLARYSNSYSPYYYSESKMESDEYMEGPSLVTWVGLLENSMHALQADVSQIHDRLD